MFLQFITLEAGFPICSQRSGWAQTVCSPGTRARGLPPPRSFPPSSGHCALSAVLGHLIDGLLRYSPRYYTAISLTRHLPSAKKGFSFYFVFSQRSQGRNGRKGGSGNSPGGVLGPGMATELGAHSPAVPDLGTLLSLAVHPPALEVPCSPATYPW